MDKSTIAQRNRHMIAAFHQTTVRQLARRIILRAARLAPIISLKTRANRILLIRPDHIGDVLLMTPAIRALKKSRPDVEIHALVGPWSADALSNFPEIDLVLTVDFPGFNRNNPKKRIYSPYLQLLRVARQLRRIGYHSVVIMRPDHWWGAMLAYFAGIRERFGYDLPDLAPFLTHRIQHIHQHAILQNLRLFEQWTGAIPIGEINFQFPTTSLDHDYIDALLAQRNIRPGDKIICVHPGSGTWVKRWTAKKWAQVADTLKDQLQATIIFTGNNDERDLIRQILSHMRHTAHAIISETRISELAALYERAIVVLGSDSGPLHVATAVGTPTAALYGPADPEEFGPWGNRQKHIVVTMDIDCRPCRVLDWGDDDPQFHPCARDITVGAVLEAARRAASYRDYVSARKED